MSWKRFIAREGLIILGLISAAFLVSEIWYLSTPPTFTKSYDDYLGFCLTVALVIYIIYIGFWFIRAGVWRKRFIAREYLIVLGLIGSGLIIAYICFRAGVLYRGQWIPWKYYETNYLGRPIFEFKTESGVPLGDWFPRREREYEIVPPRWNLDPGIYPGYKEQERMEEEIRRIEEEHRRIRETHHHFHLKKSFVPPDREWCYFFAVADKPGDIKPSWDWNLRWPFTPFTLWKEKPGARHGFLLSLHKGERRNTVEITQVLIHKPRKFYPFYIRYMRKYLIIAYAGFWFIRAGVWGVKRLRMRKKSGG